MQDQNCACQQRNQGEFVIRPGSQPSGQRFCAENRVHEHSERPWFEQVRSNTEQKKKAGTPKQPGVVPEELECSQGPLHVAGNLWIGLSKSSLNLEEKSQVVTSFGAGLRYALY